uniref:Calmodulin n=1 Tax=Macrostomum lignano TaxID=282301 RepID=A0A1I8JCB5_9PLAT
NRRLGSSGHKTGAQAEFHSRLSSVRPCAAFLFRSVLNSLRDLFNAFDTDGNGTLDRAEFGALLRAFSTDLDEPSVLAIMADVDRDRNGCVDFAEFEAVAAKHIGAELPDLRYLADFRALDADRNGLLSRSEAAELASRLGRAVDPNRLAAADKNGDGNLNYPEFVQLMQ